MSQVVLSPMNLNVAPFQPEFFAESAQTVMAGGTRAGFFFWCFTFRQQYISLIVFFCNMHTCYQGLGNKSPSVDSTFVLSNLSDFDQLAVVKHLDAIYERVNFVIGPGSSVIEPLDGCHKYYLKPKILCVSPEFD